MVRAGGLPGDLVEGAAGSRKERRVVVELALTESQSETLASLLESEISEIGMEIAHTDRLAFRDQLKSRRQRLRDVLEALREAEHRPTDENRADS